MKYDPTGQQKMAVIAFKQIWSNSVFKSLNKNPPCENLWSFDWSQLATNQILLPYVRSNQRIHRHIVYGPGVFMRGLLPTPAPLCDLRLAVVYLHTWQPVNHREMERVGHRECFPHENAVEFCLKLRQKLAYMSRCTVWFRHFLRLTREFWKKCRVKGTGLRVVVKYTRLLF